MEPCEAFKWREICRAVFHHAPPLYRCANQYINTNNTYGRYVITVRLEPHDRKRGFTGGVEVESIKFASISVFV